MVEHVKGILAELELLYSDFAVSWDLPLPSPMILRVGPAQQRWLEISSVSNFETFQANLLVRYKNKEGKKQLCHTLTEVH